MRKIIVALTFLLACTMPVICMAESKEPQKVVTIDGFRGCKWGCSGDEIAGSDWGIKRYMNMDHLLEMDVDLNDLQSN